MVFDFPRRLAAAAVFVSASAAFAQSSPPSGAQPAYLDPTQPPDRHMDNLVLRPTLAD